MQPSGPLDEKEYIKQLEEVKRKLKEAEKCFAIELSSKNYFRD
ncbi:hypothetical protein [Psychrobacillus lasiicapitis]|nr:hypothetical protein [Psychrobacillus lasiicapitis]